MKNKSVIKKIIDPLLLIMSAVFLFVHYFFDSDRTAWYLKDIEANLAIIFLIIFLYKTREFKHGLTNFLYKCFCFAIFSKCFIHIIDEFIALIFNIHIHKFFLCITSLVITTIAIFAVNRLMKKGIKNEPRKC